MDRVTNSALTMDELLRRARAIAQDTIAPCANAVDQGDLPPRQAVRLLADAGLLGLSTPVEHGGHGAPPDVLAEYTETLAAACGTTCFVQGQHISACALIAASRNEDLKLRVLPDLASGKRLSGVAFAHVRRAGPPILRAEETPAGYRLNGTAAWFTGWGVMTDVLIAGTLPTGRFVYVFTSLGQSPHLTATAPMRLCAMNASATVSLICKDLLVPRSQEVKCVTPQEMSATDAGAILAVAPQIFGVTQASIALTRELAESRRSPAMRRAADAVEAELTTARDEVAAWRGRMEERDYKENALAIRARCIEMGVRAAHMAVAAGAGASNSRDHTAQRLFREAMFYTIIAQTRDAQNATLARLAASAETAKIAFP